MNLNESFNDLAHKSLEYVSSLGQLNLGVFERIASRQTAAATLAVEHSVRLTTGMAESKHVNDVVISQIEATKELNTRLFSESKENLQLATQVHADYRAWFEKVLAELSSGLRKAVPAV